MGRYQVVEGSGARTALAQAIDEAPVPELQPALFPADQVVSLPTGQERSDALKRRGAGRPPGSMNRKTAQIRDYVLARGCHPIDVLTEAYSRPVQTLADELGCTPLEAFRVQMDAARVVLEYVEGKQPVSVNVNGQGVIPVIFELGSPMMGGNKDEFFQPLIDHDAPQLNSGELDSGS